jgi:two-component system nitrate/nitrite response regulator NarL
MRGSDDPRRQKISVIIAADVRLYRDGLAASLAQGNSFSVVTTSSDHGETLARVQDLAPHVVVVVDIAMRDGLELIRDLGRKSDSAKVLAFAVDEVSLDILECAEAGAAGYVTADASLEDLVEAIERIAREELVCSPRIAARLFKRIAERNDKPPVDVGQLRRLTVREHEVLDFIRQGNSNKEIAQKLNIAEPTVKNHVHHLLEKMAVTTRGQAAARASLPLRRRQLDCG